MAQPYLTWSQPAAGKLNNDLVTISNKAPVGLKDPAGNDIGDKYYATFNSVSRSNIPAVPGTPEGPEGNPPATPGTPAYTVYSYVDNGHMSLKGGVFELLPFTGAVSPATTVTYTDFAGTGRSPYPASYATNDGSPQQAGILVCGAYTNIESQYTYTLGTNIVPTTSSGTYGTGATPGYDSPGPPNEDNSPGNPVHTPGALTGAFTTWFGVTTGPSMTVYYLDGTFGGWASRSENRISENYTVGGTYHNGTSVTNVHTGAIEFEVAYDTEAIIKYGNVTKTTTGTASWAAGQARTVTFTCASPHCLTDANNRVYVTGASNNAINGLWNVATVTSDTAFTARIFGATCATITSSVNIVTYDGIDKAGGILRSKSGTISTIYQSRTGTQAGVPAGPGGTPEAIPALHSIHYWYDGDHGVVSSGEVTVTGSAYDFTESVTRTSGTRLTRLIAASAGGWINDTTTIWSGTADAYDAGQDITVIAGGMAGNNQVILRGDVYPRVDFPYRFQGNTSTNQIASTVEFTGERKQRSMFTDSGLTINSGTGSVTTGGEFNGVDGGMKEIDSWCPRYMHAKIKALERNDPAELFKANTSGQHALDQMLASPMVDSSDNITTFLPLHETFHESIHFTMRAQKKQAHRRTSTFTENEDWIKRDFYINVYNNSLSDRNEIILDYVDITNKTIIANTDLAFTDADGNLQTNTEHLANGYSNGVFTNL